MSLLQARDLTIEYSSRDQTLHAVSAASVEVGPGEVVGILGDSGSGKSTLLLGLLAMTRPGGRISAGSVSYDGTEMVGAPAATLARIRGAQIGFITQHPKASLDPLSRVGDQVVAGIVRRGRAPTKAAARRLSIDLLRTVGIADAERRLRAWPHELSGGMAQRVLIAMALSTEPTVLLADEPTSGLDVTLQAQILDDLRVAASTVGSSLVIVTHDVGVVAQYCDRVYVMNSGEVVEAARAPEFFAAPRHPASLALLTAEDPDRFGDLRLLGPPVDRRNLPPGCFLQSRCPFAEAADGCVDVHPELAAARPEHRVRCHRQQVVADARRGLEQRHD